MLQGVKTHADGIPFHISNVTTSCKKPSDKDWKCFSYDVTITSLTRSTTVDYHKGIGHIGVLQRKVDTKTSSDPSLGTPYIFEWRRLTRSEERLYNSMAGFAKAKPIPPQIEEISDCLKSDCRCIRDYVTWAEFASNLGYDADSIKDREVYMSCQRLYDQMRDLLRGDFYTWMESPTSDEVTQQERDSDVVTPE